MLGSILGGLGLCCACGSPNPAQGCLEVFAKPRSSTRLRKLRNHVVYRYEIICKFLLYLGPSWNISTNLSWFARQLRFPAMRFLNTRICIAEGFSECLEVFWEG